MVSGLYIQLQTRGGSFGEREKKRVVGGGESYTVVHAGLLGGGAIYYR